MKTSKVTLANTVIAGAIAIQGNSVNAQIGSSADTESTDSIRPFQVHFPQADLDDLRRRILATR